MTANNERKPRERNDRDHEQGNKHAVKAQRPAPRLKIAWSDEGQPEAIGVAFDG